MYEAVNTKNAAQHLRAADLPNQRGISAAHSFSTLLVIGAFRRASGRRLTQCVVRKEKAR